MKLNDPSLLSALLLLEKAGLDISTPRKQLFEKKRLEELSTPSDLELMYPLLTPKSWLNHFENGSDVPYLSNTTIRDGGQFRLSPDQKAILRELYGLTPTNTVTVSNLELYPPLADGRVCIRSFTLHSAIHVDWKVRKHVLSKASIGGKALSVGEFLRRSQLPDQGGKSTKPTTTIKESKKLEDLEKEYLP